MEEKKCSSDKHKEVKAINYCPECKIYMCNKCDNLHSELFLNHHQVNLDKDINIIFTGFCKEKDHLEKLEYFCKTHNKLVCASCIAKIKKNGKGEHHDCEIYLNKDVKEEKKNKLKNNIKTLEDLLKTIENYNNEVKVIYEKLNKDKEELKINIQKIFTKIRTAINDREDILLSEVDKKYSEIFMDENTIKQSENLPKRVKITLEKGKEITNKNKWDNENIINSLINECLNIENEINEINKINNAIQKINNYDKTEILFSPKEENKINEFIKGITSFGNIEINIYNGVFDNSTILMNDEYNNYEFILKEIENRNSKIKETKLIYRASRDGDNINNFFKKCNEIQNIILLIKTHNNTRFGGYTKIGFKKQTSSEKIYKDNSAFVFSLDKKKIYPVKKDKDAIRCCYCCCPQFYYSTIYLYENFLSKTDNYVGSVNDNYEGFLSDYELNNGTQNFKVLDLEIYQILF